MARANLRELIGNLADAETATPAAGAPPAPVVTDSSPTRVPTVNDGAEGSPAEAGLKRSGAPAKRTHTRMQGTDAEVHFSSFERKGTRLRTDQQNALTEHARRLNKAKGVGGQRITDNTLIRVAIDLLLSRIVSVSGRNEDELRRSVGLRGDKR